MNRLIIVTGPTAVGKSELAINLAKRVNGEIISADSIQVYIGLDIGSAKISKENMQSVKHYLIDELDPFSEFNVYKFKEMASLAINEIYNKGKIPIIVGGTGFYIQSILYDIDFTKEEDNNIRHNLELLAKTKGNMYLHDMLKEIDKESAEVIHPNNVKRVIRAIEYYQLNNRPISQHNNIQKRKKSSYDATYFVLNDQREALYERINKRVDEMIKKGLVGEVKKLMDMGLDLTYNSMQAIGYKEIFKYLSGEISLEDAISDIKKNSRHYAKRQLTWFRRENDVKWININEYDYDKERILSEMTEIINYE